MMFYFTFQNLRRTYLQLNHILRRQFKILVIDFADCHLDLFFKMVWGTRYVISFYSLTLLSSIEKASEAHEHLVKYAVALLEGDLPLPQLLQLAHLLVYHLRRFSLSHWKLNRAQSFDMEWNCIAVIC